MRKKYKKRKEEMMNENDTSMDEIEVQRRDTGLIGYEENRIPGG